MTETRNAAVMTEDCMHGASEADSAAAATTSAESPATPSFASDELALSAKGWEILLLPALGGRIAACRWQHPNGQWIDLIAPLTRPFSFEEEGGCFPLTPFSNRLRNGRFSFGQQAIEMPLNTPGPHVEHGHGWQRPWSGLRTCAQKAVLQYLHEPDAWPFSYSVRQEFELTAAALRITLTAHNRSPGPMPYGFGLHPYFPATTATTLQASLATAWEVDAEVMPVRSVPAAAVWGERAELRVDAVELDNGFAGWNGSAEIKWPERRAGLRMQADAPLRHLVVYTPRGAGHFCAEPVSHCTDAFNLAATRPNTGMLVLAPGETLSASVTLTPFSLG